MKLRINHTHIRTPLSSKQKNIEAFTRLINFSREKDYRGRRLNDRTEEGLTYCVFVWLKLSGFQCKIKGNEVVIDFDDGPFTIQVAGTHISHPHYPESFYSGETELQVFNLMGFLQWYYETF